MKHKTDSAKSNLLKEIASKSNGKVVICSAAIGTSTIGKPNTNPKSNWGHSVSIMPCAETLESAKYAIETLSINRTNIFGVCIHHTDTNTAEKARKVLKSSAFSTHIIIDKDGSATVELPFDKRAAACVGFNKWMFQLDVVGRLHINEPTDEQIRSLKNILKLLSCGREIVNLDEKFAKSCRKKATKEVQEATESRYAKTYAKYSKLAKKKGSWSGVLDDLPFTVIYHGEVRPTLCCGENLIDKLPEIIKEIQEEN